MTNAAKRPWTGRAVLIFAAVAPIWTIICLRSNWLVALLPLFISHLLLLYPTLVPGAQWWGLVVRSFETKQREVWITIDDGPSDDTAAILDLLDHFRARATFFLIGERAARMPQMLEEIRARGHAVANHTDSHPSASFWCASPKRTAREIDACSGIIENANTTPKFFRAPAGLKNCFLHPALWRRGMMLIGWSARGFDTSHRAPETVASRIVRDVHPGTIVLLHEGHPTPDDPHYNVACIQQTLEKLTALGYRFVIPAPEQLQAAAACEK